MINRLRNLAINVFNAGLDPSAVDRHAFLKAQTISVAIAVAIIASFGFSLFYTAFSPFLAWMHFAAGILFLSAYCYCRYNPDPVIVTRACCAAAVTITWIVNWAFGGIMSPAIAWFVLPAVASALILGWRDGWFWIGVGCAGVSVLFCLDYYDVLPANSVPESYRDIAAYLYCLSLAIVIGILFSFWVARQNVLETQLSARLVKSEHDAYLAGLLAESAIIANESMEFAQAARVCLALICDARKWDAGHIWQALGHNKLRSTGIWYFSATSDWSDLAPRTADLDNNVEDLAAARSANTCAPLVEVDLVSDPRCNPVIQDGPRCTLKWPVEVEGKTDLVLEFFSAHPIVLDDELKALTRHIAVELSHVRQREIVRERTELLAHTDTVTGLPNRAGFERLFAQKLNDAKRSGTTVALMFVDLDGFKRVNDSLGHVIGDRLLHVVGRRVDQHVRSPELMSKFVSDPDAIAARIGGDEFTLAVSGLDGHDDAATVAKHFLELLSDPIDVGFQDVNIGASIGIAMFPHDAESLSDLMRLADAAMYEAKALPGNQYRFTTPALNGMIRRRLWVENELRHAINKNELILEFVPIAAATSGRIIGNEVALRWPHRDGEIAFKEFFAIAESSNLICDLGYWAIEKTCAAIADQRWVGRANAKMSLDVSLLQLQQPNFVELVIAILQRYDCPTGSLEFEFSDTRAILRNEECRRNIRKLHEVGIRIVLDRFGTGYSSLVDLSELPIWRIKLDRKFLEAVNVADGNRSMGRAIISMAHSMGVETTVIDVATSDQAEWFRELGCDALQGPWVGVGADAPLQSRVQSDPDIDRRPPISLDTPA